MHCALAKSQYVRKYEWISFAELSCGLFFFRSVCVGLTVPCNQFRRSHVRVVAYIVWTFLYLSVLTKHDRIFDCVRSSIVCCTVLSLVVSRKTVSVMFMCNCKLDAFYSFHFYFIPFFPLFSKLSLYLFNFVSFFFLPPLEIYWHTLYTCYSWFVPLRTFIIPTMALVHVALNSIRLLIRI